MESPPLGWETRTDPNGSESNEKCSADTLQNFLKIARTPSHCVIIHCLFLLGVESRNKLKKTDFKFINTLWSFFGFEELMSHYVY